MNGPRSFFRATLNATGCRTFSREAEGSTGKAKLPTPSRRSASRGHSRPHREQRADAEFKDHFATTRAGDGNLYCAGHGSDRCGGRRQQGFPRECRPADEELGLQFYAMPVEGIEVTLKLHDGKPFKMLVVDRSYGLPETKPRPENMIPTPYGVSDVTLVSKSFSF